uniref:Uncharacterized protein n=1 Tax=Anguilla anguilla TaxID=7936 RepID=A0A0E9WW41_ANGAN
MTVVPLQKQCSDLDTSWPILKPNSKNSRRAMNLQASQLRLPNSSAALNAGR